MKKKAQAKKSNDVEELEFERKSPDAKRAREGRKVKVQKRKERREKRLTQKEGKGSVIPAKGKSPGEPSSARKVFSVNKKRVANVPRVTSPRVSDVYSTVKVVNDGVRPVDTKRSTLRPSQKDLRRDQSIPLKKGTKKQTGKFEKQYQSSDESSDKKHRIAESKKQHGATKKPKKQQITPNATRITPNAQNIDETEQFILHDGAPVEQNKTALYPNRNPVEALNSTLKRVIRKGRILRKDARPPSIKLTRAICQMIRLGSYPEVSARAFGIQSNVFRTWVQNGFEDITNGENTPYAKFVLSVDIADAQSEVLDVAEINNAIDGWQAKAWIRERKSFQRWGMRALQLSGDINQNLTPTQKQEELTMEPEIAAEVLTALEEAGIVQQAGMEHLSGIAESEEILARNADDIESVTLEE